MSYTKLFQSIITSTIWSEDDKTRIVWITLMALADKNGEVQGSVPGIARLAGVSVDDCRSAIEKFLSPDPDSRTKDDGGRRIEIIDGGWTLINHQKYRKMASDADRLEKAAIRQKRFRERGLRNGPGIPDSNAIVTLPSRTSDAPVTQELHQNSQAEAEADTKADTETKKEDLLSAGGRPERSNFIEVLWLVFPPTSRNRSSKQKVADAWTKTKRKPDEGDTIAAASKWATCDDWTKDGGKYAPGAHIWIKDRKWESLPEAFKGNFAGIQEDIPL